MMWKIHDDKMLMVCYSDGIAMIMIIEVMRGDNNDNSDNKYDNKNAVKKRLLWL